MTTHRWAPAAGAALAALVAFVACSRPPDATPAGDHVARVDTAPPTAAIRIPYSLQGVPGPWWRDDAMHEDFEADQRACRAVSTEARRTATSGDRKDAAYRAFLDCMTSRAWTRGLPPMRAPEG